MKKITLWVTIIFLAGILMSGTAMAQEEVEDITKDVLTGPGSVNINTTKNIMMSYGAQARIIPVSESDFDFGLEDSVPALGFLGGALPDNFFQGHLNEAGTLNNNYIRTEARLYFNALPKDRKWSFYAALEFDRPLETTSVDDRGGKDFDTSNFGLERLHGTYELPFNTRFHAGWDIWGVDVMDGGGLVYGDDNPGFWLTGDYDAFSFNVGYFKLVENNFQADFGKITELGSKNNDRDLYAGYLTFEPEEGQKIQPFYTFDRIRSTPTGTLLDALKVRAEQAEADITEAVEDLPDTDFTDPRAVPDTNSHHIGAYYTGKFGMLELFLEGVYQFGEAEGTGLARDDYDISAYALAYDVGIELEDMIGFGFKPHIGAIYTSGDDNPDDDELSGYTGVESAQRFSQYWGGENTIIGDTNFMLGSILYGYIPEMYGNGTPVATGGLSNAGGLGVGRGDNPGMTMTSVGITLTPKRFLIYKTNVNSFWWNEDFRVTSFVDGETPTTVESGYTGSEWDNELTLAMSKNSFVKGQFSFFFPGEVIEDVGSARTATPAGPGRKSDDTAIRLGMEFIWKF